MHEEIGIDRVSLPGVAPVIMSVGEVKSFAQPAALVHVHLPMTLDEVREAHAYAPDATLETSEGNALIDVVRGRVLHDPGGNPPLGSTGIGAR